MSISTAVGKVFGMALAESQENSGKARALWTVREVAEYLGWHEKTVYAKTERRELPCIRQGRNLRFDPNDITRWLASRKE